MLSPTWEIPATGDEILRLLSGEEKLDIETIDKSVFCASRV